MDAVNGAAASGADAPAGAGTSKSASADSQAYSVTQAMEAAKRGLEQIRLRVVGEVSQVTDAARYKAVYFDVRDEKASMPCIMWRNIYRESGVALAQGMLVEMDGRFSAYPARGQLQFSVSRLALAGEGDLRVQVARIAAKLKAEGLMDPSRKRRIPALPRRIALVTSPHGKAVHDVVRTLRRRYPLAELLFFGVKVEGDDAPAQMSAAIEAVASLKPVPDVVLLVRGGGSYEALMPFNDEGLARTVAACPVPVVTGIGHEPDNSICDMVADLRCSTPSTAAEGATRISADELGSKVANAKRLLAQALVHRLEAAAHRLDRVRLRPVWQDERYVLGPFAQSLDELSMRLSRAIPDALARDAQRLELARQRLHRAIPDALARDAQRVELASGRLVRLAPAILERDARRLELARQRLMSAGAALGKAEARELHSSQEALLRAGPAVVEAARTQIAVHAARLDALSPLKTLSRGYSITYAQDGKTVVDSVDKAAPGDAVRVQLRDGQLACTVDEVQKGS